MKKVLIVNDLIKGGGVEKLLQDFAKRWHDKYDVTVMSRFKEGDFYEYSPRMSNTSIRLFTEDTTAS